MSPELIYGQYGAIVLLVYAVHWLNRELQQERKKNDELRDSSLDLLKRYQERDEEERRWRVEQERNRLEASP